MVYMHHNLPGSQHPAPVNRLSLTWVEERDLRGERGGNGSRDDPAEVVLVGSLSMQGQTAVDVIPSTRTIRHVIT